MLIPEKIITVASSHQGHYIAGATANGRIYLWHISSGLLIKVFDAHYRSILRLGFSNDDSLLISAGEDATINVWLVSSLLSNNNNNDTNDMSSNINTSPLYSWSDHTLPVTDIYIGSGTLSTTRVYTSSSDFTVKVWDLATGELLTTFLFPKAVTTLIVNPSETMLFAACGNEIYLVELYKRRQQQTYQSVQSLGGLGKVEGVGTDSLSSSLIFSGHTNIIHSLSLSFDGSLLISGSEDGNCIVWDVNSRQSLRQFTSHKGPVTHVSCILKPTELSTGMVNTSQQKYTPMAWKSFKRSVVTNEEKNSIDQQLMNTLSDLDQHQQLIEKGSLYNSDLSSEYSFLNQARDKAKLSNQQDPSGDLQSQVVNLQNELSNLYEHHGKVKSIHNEAYHTLVDQFISDRKKAKHSLSEDE
ncbi:unnamed protein product [Cunninghamella echinulata]